MGQPIKVSFGLCDGPQFSAIAHTVASRSGAVPLHVSIPETSPSGSEGVTVMATQPSYRRRVNCWQRHLATPRFHPAK
jgi:hypothetical protein